MLRNSIFKKKRGSETTPESIEFQEIMEIRHRLNEHIKSTSQNFALMNDKFNKIQTKVDILPNEISFSNGTLDLDLLKKMELQIAEMSKQIDDINEIINVKIKGSLKEIYTFIQAL